MDIFSIFNLLYLVYIFRGAQILLRIVREWTPLRQPPLNRDKKYVAGQASFYIAVPPSVIVHELFHALTIWAFGGRVVDFGFTFYGGYVVPDRLFSDPQQWLISISGTIGSLLFAVVVWLGTRQNSSQTIRYFGLRTLRTLIVVSLIFYPLLALGGFGDWARIYDFSVTPTLSGATAVAHLLSLGLYFRASRRGWFEIPGFETPAAEASFAQLAQASRHNPQDEGTVIQYIEELVRGGAENQAHTRLKAYLNQYPENGTAYVLLARLEIGHKSHVPKKSKQYAEKALQLGLNDPGSKATAYRILAEYALQANQNQVAAEQFSQALAAISSKIDQENPQPQLSAHLADLYARRSLAYQRQHQVELAIRDLQQALELASAAADHGRSQRYREALAKLQHQNGPPLGSSANAPSQKDMV